MKTTEHLVIETATPNDFLEILQLYRRANRVLLEKGIVQWNDEYPSPTTLKENLAQKVTWIIRQDDRPIATVTLDSDQDPQYQLIQWVYKSDQVLVVHRLCVDPALQGLGLAKRFMHFAEEYAQRHHFQVIRLDAFLGNPYSQRLYPSLGYHEAIGYCYYQPGEIMCNCFEKWVGW